MRKEVVTDEEIKKDIRDAFLGSSWVVKALAAELVVGLAIAVFLYSVIFSSFSSDEKIVAAVVFAIGLIPIPVMYFIDRNKLKRFARATENSYEITVEKLEDASRAEDDLKDGLRKAKANSYRGKRTRYLRDESVAVPTGRIMFFNSGVWLLPDKCYRWSKENMFYAESLKKNFHVGDEFYVICAVEGRVAVAYPLRVFELSGDLEIKDDKGL